MSSSSSHLELYVAGLPLPDQLGSVVLAADPLRLVVLDGALQVLGAGSVPEAEEPGRGAPAGHQDRPAGPHQHRQALIVNQDRAESQQSPAQHQELQGCPDPHISE